MRPFVRLVFTIAALLPSAASSQLTGTLMSSDGSALEGVEVRAFAVESSAARTERLRSESPGRVAIASSGSARDGRFSLKIEGHEVVDLLFTKSGHAPAGARVESSGEIGAHVLSPAETVQGTVNWKGGPLAGAIVRWAADGVELHAATDESGRYTVPDPSVWMPSYEIWHPRIPMYQSRENVRTPWAPPAVDVEIPASVLSGVVTSGPDRTPIAGALVSVDGVPYGTTEEDGTFSVEADPRWEELIVRSGELVGRAGRGAKELRVRLEKGGRISGRVLDGRGRGVREASISISRGTPGYRRPFMELLVTTADGSYTSSTLADGKYFVVVQRPGFTWAMVEVELEGSNLVRDLPLAASARVAGRVSDEAGRPVALADVEIEVQGTRYRRPRATTGPDGRYVVLDVPAAAKATATARRTARPPGGSGPLEILPGARLSGVDITLPSGHAMSGRVVDAEGLPVGGARVVRASSPDSLQWAFAEHTAPEKRDLILTRGDGTFTVWVEKGTWYLAFKATGFADTFTEGKVVDGPVTIGDVTLEPGGEIEGRVTRKSGGPVVNASVAISDPNMRPVQTVTDDEGRFSLRDLPVRSYQLSVMKSDGTSVTRLVDVPATGLVIEAPDAVTVRGRVIDAETKGPVRAFRAGVALSPTGSGGGRSHETDDGSFEIDIVLSEESALIVSAPGYLEVRKLIGPAAADGEPLVIALSRGMTVQGRVTDDSGRPLEGVHVGYDRQQVIGRTGSSTTRVANVVTDSTGAFRFEGVAPGEARLSFSKAGFLRAVRTIETSDGERRLDVELTTGIALRGIVVDERGAPVPRAEVDGASMSGERQGASAVTGDDGRFVLEPLNRGRTMIRVKAAGYLERLVQNIDANGADEVRVDLERGAIIEGHVAGIERNEMQQVVIEVGGERHERRVNPAGEFRIDGVRPGRSRVSARLHLGKLTRSSKPMEVELVSNLPSRVTLEFAEGATVRGTVTIGDRPFAGAMVHFEAKGQRSNTFVSTFSDEHGRYEAPGLLDGEYVVTAGDPRSGRSMETQYEVRGPGELDLHLEEGTLEGRVTEAGTGRPVSGASVVVDDASRATQYFAPTATTDSDGRFVMLSTTKGQLRVTVRKDGYGVVVRNVTSDGEVRGLEIEMERSSGVKLRVVDGRDGRGLQSVVASCDLSGNVLMTDHFESTHGAVTVDLAPGQYVLEVGSPGGYAMQRLRVTVPTNELRVAMTQGGRLIVKAAHERSYRVTLRDDAGYVVRRWPGIPPQDEIAHGARTYSALAPGEYTIEAVPVAGGEAIVHRVRIEEHKTEEIELE